MFLIALGFYSLQIAYQKSFFESILQLKYIHIQQNIHINNIEQQIRNNPNIDTDSIHIGDNRFDLAITTQQNDQNTTYHIKLTHTMEPQISFYKQFTILQ